MLLFSFTNIGQNQLESLAKSLAPKLGAGDTITLSGDLGAGKSTFCRALIRSMGVTEDIPSPTFTLVQTYETENAVLWHCDLYRLHDAAEIAELGLDEAFQSAITLIEWPERAETRLPPGRLRLILGFTADTEARNLKIEGDSAWQSRLTGWTP